jgi:hypothetical protein
MRRRRRVASQSVARLGYSRASVNVVRPTPLVFATAVTAACGTACGGPPSQMPPGPEWRQYVVDRPGTSGPGSHQWGPDVCARVDLKPDYHALTEASLVAFLQGQGLDARVERQPVEANKPGLVFVFVAAPGTSRTVPLRVAILPSADEAGRDLYDALLLRGQGAWGVHRANLAVLGPSGDEPDDLQFAGKTRLACWGTFTVAEGGDAVVVPGGYAEP